MADDQINAVNLGHEVNEVSLRENPSQRSPEQEDQENDSPASPRSETESDAPHIPPGPQPELNDPFRALVIRSSQQFGLQTIFFLHFVWNLLCRLGSASATVSTSVLRSLQSHMYVFFQSSPYPYRLQDYVVSGPGVPPIEWYYDADKKIFLSANLYNTSTEYDLHHFEWLSGQVKYNDLLLQDISDYLEDAKWAGTVRPTPAVILSAWSLHSGIVLHLSEGLRLHTINQDASESVLPIRGNPT